MFYNHAIEIKRLKKDRDTTGYRIIPDGLRILRGKDAEKTQTEERGRPVEGSRWRPVRHFRPGQGRGRLYTREGPSSSVRPLRGRVRASPFRASRTPLEQHRSLISYGGCFSRSPLSLRGGGRARRQGHTRATRNLHRLQLQHFFSVTNLTNLSP